MEFNQRYQLYVFMSYQMSDVNIGAWIDPYSFNRESVREQRVGSMFVCNSICDFIVVKQVGEPAMGLSVSLLCYFEYSLGSFNCTQGGIASLMLSLFVCHAPRG